jgi:homospermidine synthase
MTTKSFIVQFRSDERTRWLCSDEELAKTIRNLADSAAAVHTAGTKPGVVVARVKPGACKIHQDAIGEVLIG